MGLFKRDKLAAFEVQEESDVEKFSHNGKFYDLQAYVKSRELALRNKIMEDHVKTIKNRQKTEKEYVKDKNAVTYIEYAMAKQLVDRAEILKVSAVDIKSALQPR